MPTQDVTIRILRDVDASRDALQQLFQQATWVWFSYAWMSSAGGQAEHWRWLPLERVKQGVVGLEFAHTEPHVLQELLEVCGECVRVVPRTDGTFHPKLVVAECGDHMRAIVGSSNFTGGGFRRNVEVNVELSGPIGAKPIMDLIEVIGQHYQNAKPLTRGLIERYTHAHAKRPRAPVLLWPREGGPASGIVRRRAELDIEWADYIELFGRRHDRRGLVFSESPNDNSYESELAGARNRFQANKPFHRMNPADRKYLSGLVEANGSWGWFGTTKSSGRFRHYIGTEPPTPELKVISRALECVPLTEDVDFDELKERSKQVMGIRGVALGCWSRLLCAKRPDKFLSINNAVREPIRKLFKLKHCPRSFEGYLELLEQIHSLPWARSGKPDGHKREVAMWRGRVAMLDALLYEPAA